MPRSVRFAAFFGAVLALICASSRLTAAEYAPPDKAKALESVKALVAGAAKSGKKVEIWINIGTLVKAELKASDDKAVSVNFEGNPFSVKWDKIPLEQIPTMVKNCIQDDPKRVLTGMDFCLANEQLDKAEEFMKLASENKKLLGDELTVRIKALSARHEAAAAAANPAPVRVASASARDKDADPAPYDAPAKIAFRPSEYDSLTPIKDVAAAIDNSIEISLAEMGIHPEPLCDDPAFLRRVFLDITGQIPTPDDVLHFMSESGNKRAKAIDELLKRPEYADHWASFWSILLVGRRTREEADVKPHFFRSWLREEFARNEKFDKIVGSILTAGGENDKDGPANYLTFHMNDTLPITVGHISQTFLGARIACAQCHDHPFDKWTQQDFWGFSAFLANTRSERKELRDDPKDPMKVTRQWHVLVDTNARNGGAKYDPPQADLRLPPKVLDGPVFTSSAIPAGASKPARRRDKGMAEDKGKDMSMDKGKDMAGRDKPMDKSKDMAGMMSMDDNSMMSAAAGTSGEAGMLYRKAFAAWVTSLKNEKFSQSAVNRIWRNMFGFGLVEPVDDIRPKNPPVYPDVMKILADDFNASGRDMQRLIAIVANTRAYQRSSIGVLKNADRMKQVRYFARAEVRPMTPEELFLAVIKATAGEEKSRSIVEGMRKRDASYAYGAKMEGVPEDLSEMNRLMDRFIGTSTAEDRAGKLQFEGTVSQALMMMHSAFMQNYINQGVKRFRGDMTWLFATTLGRPPTPEEQGAFASMSSDPQGVLWVLLNSSEFVTIH